MRANSSRANPSPRATTRPRGLSPVRTHSSPRNTTGYSPRILGASASVSTTATVDLDEAISDVVVGRLQSLADVRAKIEELAHLQRQEQEVFASQMENILHQTQEVQLSQRNLEVGYEERLANERRERKKAVELMERFRTQGTEVMASLKSALRDLQSKHRNEVERSHQYQLRIRQLEEQLKNNRSSHPAHVMMTDNAETASLKEKVAVMAQLLEEEDSVIMELRKRNDALERRAAQLAAQRDRLLDEGAGATTGASSQHSELLEEFNSNQNAMPRERLVQLVRGLHAQLKSEQVARLRVEEQAARMAGVQDQLLHKMEDRVKELESTNPPRTRTPPISVGLKVPQLTGAAAVPSTGTPQNNTPRAETRPANPPVVPPVPVAAVTVLPPAPSTTASLPPEPIQQPVDGFGEIPAPKPTSIPSTVAAKTSDRVPTLEEQLQAVSAEFKQSLAQWQNEVDGSIDDYDFLPNSPPPTKPS